MRDEKEIYDLAVIGGGIAGAGIARDATLRGIQTVLFEKNNFGSGTSSKSSRLIHGGVRYLEVAWNHFKKGELQAGWKNFCFVFHSLRESALLGKIAPELITPLPLTIPIYKNEGQSPFMIYLGTTLYALMGAVTGSGKMPQILGSPDAVLKRIPELNPDGLSGGVVIWDHLTHDLKLVNKIVEHAKSEGLTAFKHTEVISYHFREAERCYEIKVAGEGETNSFFARKLVNATGAWIDQVRSENNEKGEDFIVPVAGCHITLKKFTEHSVILKASDDRLFFVINLGETARVGTTERHCTTPDCVTATNEEIDYLLGSLHEHFPNTNLTQASILSSDAGIRPLAKPSSKLSAHNISREHEVRIGPSGVLHILGVKITDHRRAAEHIVDQLVPELSQWNPSISKKTKTRHVKL